MTDTSNNYRKVAANTAGGALLRRYWHPILLASELKNLGDKKRVELLGEKLVAFKTMQGEYGLIQETCPHRKASLYYGFVEDDRLRCPYHGWAFDKKGVCLEQPFSPKKEVCGKKICHAYPIKELGGLLFAYLGPADKEPLLPAWEILTRTDGVRQFEVQEDYNCNWFQLQENAVDVTHTFYLHAYMFKTLNLPDTSGFGRTFEWYGFQPFPLGLIKSWKYKEAKEMGWGNLMIFPNILRIQTEMHWRVPVNDTKTKIIWLNFHTATDKELSQIPPVIHQPNRVDDTGKYKLDTFSSQDAMACETPGAFYIEAGEKLSASDYGVVLLRKMLVRECNKIRSDPDHDPMGIFRKESDMSFYSDLRKWMGGDLAMSCHMESKKYFSLPEEQVFNKKHKIIRLK